MESISACLLYTVYTHNGYPAHANIVRAMNTYKISFHRAQLRAEELPKKNALDRDEIAHTNMQHSEYSRQKVA